MSPVWITLAFLNMHHAVAVGVGVGQVDHLHLLAVDLEGDPVGEGEDRQRQVRRRRAPAVEDFVVLLGRHPGPHVVVRHQHHPVLAEGFVAAGMVAVPVGARARNAAAWAPPWPPPP